MQVRDAAEGQWKLCGLCQVDLLCSAGEIVIVIWKITCKGLWVSILKNGFEGLSFSYCPIWAMTWSLGAGPQLSAFPRREGKDPESYQQIDPSLPQWQAAQRATHCKGGGPLPTTAPPSLEVEAATLLNSQPVLENKGVQMIPFSPGEKVELFFRSPVKLDGVYTCLMVHGNPPLGGFVLAENPAVSGTCGMSCVCLSTCRNMCAKLCLQGPTYDIHRR